MSEVHQVCAFIWWTKHIDLQTLCQPYNVTAGSLSAHTADAFTHGLTTFWLVTLICCICSLTYKLWLNLFYVLLLITNHKQLATLHMSHPHTTITHISSDLRRCYDCASFGTVCFTLCICMLEVHFSGNEMLLVICVFKETKLDSQVLLLHAFSAHFWFIHDTTVVTSADSLADTLTCKSHQVSDLKGSFLIYSSAHRIPLQFCQSTLIIALKTLTAGSSIEIESSCVKALPSSLYPVNDCSLKTLHCLTSLSWSDQVSIWPIKEESFFLPLHWTWLHELCSANEMPKSLSIPGNPHFNHPSMLSLTFA